jgi:hypothetical protein
MPIAWKVVTVATAGQAQPLASASQVCAWVQLQSVRASGAENTGKFYVGDSSLVAGSGEGAILTPGGVLLLPWMGDQNPYDLSGIYVAGDTAGDQLLVLYGVK